jgi:hypothetical protein
MSPERRQLIDMEKTGAYVFHGSGEELGMLEPRQAYNYLAEHDTEEPDGEPAVFASSLADYAIFMAIINKKNCPDGLHSSSGMSRFDDGSYRLCLRATQQTLDQLIDTAEGWVHVLERSSFTQRADNDIEFACYVPVVPIRKIRVGKGDMPDYIEVFTSK